jgi:predicted nucleic acid-binding Zn ribbon protein
MESTTEKTCLECGKPIKGRIDKKFCDDWCRNAYNNKLNSDNSAYVKNVNNILRRNRRIIEELIGSEETAKASRNKLHQKGFNFTYFTNTYTTKKGVTYFYCYDFGYLPIEGDYFFLVKRKETMNS